MPISWEIAFFPRVFKNQRFWPKRKGPILADFHNWTLAALKNKKYLSNLTENGLFDAEFIEGFVETKTSKNQCLLAEK